MLNLKEKSWKTTAMGVVSILTALISIANALLNGTPIAWETTIAAITAGIGLIAARDNDKTSLDVGAKTK